jgi:uncharacterized protein (TIGR04206 family)
MDSAHTRTGARRRLLALFALAVVPGSVVIVGGDSLTLVFPLFIFEWPSIHTLRIDRYLQFTTAAIPRFLLAWPIGTLTYALALASAALELRNREDPRVTGGLLVLVGFAFLSMTLGFSRRAHYTAIPLGTVVTWTMAWWLYWPLVDSLRPSVE